MKKILLSFGVAILMLVGCGDKKQALQNSELEDVVVALINSHPLPQNTPQELIDDAQTLILRSEKDGYSLISSKELDNLMQQKFPVVLIDVSANGNYLLGHIANAKEFEFSNELKLKNGELEWNAQQDIQAYKTKLEGDKEALIVIYDEGDAPTYQNSKATLACIWAKKLGYNNVYQLIGGRKAWRERGYPLTQETPQCCTHH